MPLMTWSDKLNIGIAVVDDDHRKLVDMVNELFDGIQAGHGQDSVGKVLEKLIAYTKAHFAREEKLFVEAGYPGAAAHKKEHEKLTEDVMAAQAKYNAGATAILSVELMNFLKNWLLNHIQGSDKAYGPHLIAKGVR